MRRARDEGSTLPLVIGLLALCLAVVIVVVAATSLMLARMRLLSLADGAALAAAESFALADIRVDGAQLRVDLTDAAVFEAAAAHIVSAPTDGLHEVTLVSATTLDARSAEVVLAATWRPPLPIWLVPDGLAIQATSTARVVLQRRGRSQGADVRICARLPSRNHPSAPSNGMKKMSSTQRNLPPPV